MGMLSHAMAGLLLTDLVLDRPNPLAALHDANRLLAAHRPGFSPEAMGISWRYLDWLTPSDLHAFPGLGPNPGGVLREEEGKRVVFRNPEGAWQQVSPQGNFGICF
jgi:hypothetical protein